MSSNDFVMVPVHVSKLAAVFALLAGAAPVAVATGNAAAVVTPAMEPSPSVGTAGTASTPVADTSSVPNENEGKRDAAGTLFDASRHTWVLS